MGRPCPSGSGWLGRLFEERRGIHSPDLFLYCLTSRPNRRVHARRLVTGSVGGYRTVAKGGSGGPAPRQGGQSGLGAGFHDAAATAVARTHLEYGVRTQQGDPVLGSLGDRGGRQRDGVPFSGSDSRDRRGSQALPRVSQVVAIDPYGQIGRRGAGVRIDRQSREQARSAGGGLEGGRHTLGIRVDGCTDRGRAQQGSRRSGRGNRLVHIGLNLVGGQGPVVDPYLVDGAIEPLAPQAISANTQSPAGGLNRTRLRPVRHFQAIDVEALGLAVVGRRQMRPLIDRQLGLAGDDSVVTHIDG